MRIPASCLEWIRKQRSGYKDIRQEFNEDMIAEYKMLVPFLPANRKRILDVGCGVGGIDVYLYKHYEEEAKILLMDDSRISDALVYGYDRGASYYNSFKATRELMDVNEVYNYRICDLKHGRPKLKKIDLVVSLLSWGYHYLIDSYLEYIDSITTDDCVLIIDIRQGTNGIEEIKKVFPCIEIISTHNKSDRIAARRKK